MKNNKYREVVMISKHENKYSINLYDFMEDNRIEKHKINNCEKYMLQSFLDINVEQYYFTGNNLVINDGEKIYYINQYLDIKDDEVFSYLNDKLKVNTQIGQFNVKRKKYTIEKRVLSWVMIIGILTSNFLPTLDRRTEKPIVIEKPKINMDVVAQKEEVLTPVVEYSDLASEEVVNRSLSEEEVRYLAVVQKYSEMYFIDYEKAIELVDNNADSISNDYDNQELGIMKTLEEAYLNDDDISKKPVVSNISTNKRERLILEFASVYVIEDVDTLATLIAVYRLETGNGTSNACIEYNNFGGIMYSNNGESKLRKYKTPEIGAAAFVSVFLKIKNRAMSDNSYNPKDSLESNMNDLYCELPDWADKIKRVKNDVNDEYKLEKYISDEEPMVLIRK